MSSVIERGRGPKGGKDVAISDDPVLTSDTPAKTHSPLATLSPRTWPASSTGALPPLPVLNPTTSPNQSLTPRTSRAEHNNYAAASSYPTLSPTLWPSSGPTDILPANSDPAESIDAKPDLLETQSPSEAPTSQSLATKSPATKAPTVSPTSPFKPDISVDTFNSTCVMAAVGFVALYLLYAVLRSRRNEWSRKVYAPRTFTARIPPRIQPRSSKSCVAS